MEFLTTPDLASSDPRWSLHASSRPTLTPRTAATPRNVSDSATNTPAHNSVTPRNAPAHSFYAPLDRAGIKSSFQSLFSPNVAAQTPALYARNAAQGLTPFINGMQTPNLVPPSTGMLPNYPPSTHVGAAQPAASPDVLSSPYLQAAAKEAVRREFMNMPSYVTPNQSGEREVPAKDSPQQVSSQVSPHQSYIAGRTPGSVGREANVPQQVSPTSGDAKVPSRSPSKSVVSNVQQAGKETSEVEKSSQVNTSPAPASAKDAVQPQRQQGSVPPQMQPYFIPPHPQAPGMVMLGQHGPMMMAPAPGAMYAPPPGMMMFPGGQPAFMQPGMLMHAQHAPGQMVRPPGPDGKAETQAERKQRIENEKQELIREFKKKTREAALVRFRQKRRERRFGKLIRYDCRKKLADARPRVKGRFVRIKEDEEESEGAQVVPDLENQR